MSPLPWRVEQQGGETLLVDCDGLPICHYFRDHEDALAIAEIINSLGTIIRAETDEPIH
jgi:hypothetical protein